MYVEDKSESFSDNMIVEFRYSKTNDAGWRWIPIRVRHDKTDEFKKGLKNYGNAYHVAESNWKSIHMPITDTMIRTGQGIPTEYFIHEEGFLSQSLPCVNKRILEALD